MPSHAPLRAPFLIGVFCLAAACSATPGPGAGTGGQAAGTGGSNTPTAGAGGAGTGGAVTGGADGSAGAPGGNAGAGNTGGTLDAGTGRGGAAGVDAGGRAGASGSSTAGGGGTSGSSGAAGSSGASGNTDGGGGNLDGGGNTDSGGRDGTGGSVDAGGTGGSGGADGGPDDDRCGVANLDPTNPPRATTVSGNLGTHDPSLIFAHGQYYLFQTGGSQGLAAKTSADLLAWSAAPAVLSPNPAWVSSQVAGATNLWAPDISYFGGVYHLYYSASTFGSNHSCIGHATRAALNAGSWADQGSVICSNASATSDNWNAIDPNVIVDLAGTPWLAFGSFWGGLKMIELTQAGARANQTIQSIAARPNNGGALEAPFIVRRCGYYYLFVSFDRCCDGADSTYKIMVGRSTSVTGPYSDRAGAAMMQGGGTLLVQGLDASQSGWHGPGHNAVIFTGAAAYNVYHAYADNGASSLRVSSLAWDTEGWPVSGGP